MLLTRIIFTLRESTPAAFAIADAMFDLPDVLLNTDTGTLENEIATRMMGSDDEGDDGIAEEEEEGSVSIFVPPGTDF